jgi:photosystem II stability/assembly factor-like uncharacterized protein
MNCFFRLLSVAIMLIISNSCVAQWTQLTTGTNSHIYCVRYAPSGDVWAGTWNGIFRSSNSGSTFNFVTGLNSTLGNSQIIGSFEDIHVTGTGTAVAAGYFYLGNDLIIFGTGNSGASWSHNYYTNTGSLPRNISSIDFDGAGNGVGVGGVGRVTRTSNNGSTWTPVTAGTTNYLEDVSWVNGTTFVMVSGNNIYRSTNSGASWTSVLGSQSSIENVSFARGTNTGYAGGSNGLKKSIDGGLTWTTLNVPPMNIRTIYTFSPDTVYLGTYDGVYRSISGGTYWEKFDMPNVKWVNDINFYDGNNGMVAGDSGYVSVTSNGGGLPMPISFFNAPIGVQCEGSTIQPINFGNPAWSYQWLINGSVVSTLHSPTLTLNQSGSVSVSLIVSNNGFSDTSSTTLSVLPIPLVAPYTVINDTICQNGQGHFRIPNSQSLVTYALFDGANLIGSQNGNGNTITLTTLTNQSVVKPYRIRANYSNVCGADTLEVIDSLFLATPAANVSASLYRDTICTGDTTTMVIYNSEPGWDYYCSNAQFTKVDGNGGTIGIPVGPITSNVTITVYARFKSLNCVKTLPGTFPLVYRFTSVSISPGTLQGSIGQAVNMSAVSSGNNAWDWDFGINASPSSGNGQIPAAPVYNVAGIDSVTLTARVDYTCSKTIRKPVYIYGNLPVSTTINCDADTLSGTMGTSSYKYCFDDFNNLHIVGFNAQSTNFAFIPYVMKLDSSGMRKFYLTYNSTGNSPGAQGLINGITADRLSNTYFATHYVADARYDIQSNFIRNKNAIVKLNEKGTFQWAIEAPLADFSDMITIDNRIFAVGINAWKGCEFQTPAGLFQYTPSISNKGDAFIMELNPDGKILSFDAFGSGGNGGVSNPAKFKVKYPLINQFFDYDTLRQNLMARKSLGGELLISGLLDASSLGSPIFFNNQAVSNNHPVGTVNEKCLFYSRYHLSNGFTDAVTLMSGQPEFITDYKETSNGDIVFVGRAKNKLITSQGTLVFPVQNYEYQFVASFNTSGSLNWLMYTDSMSMKSLGVNNDGSVSVLAYMSTKYLIVDGTGQPFNVSPTPSIGTFLLRFGLNGELLSADRTSGFAAITMQQDNCGNHHVYHSTGTPQQFRVFRTIHSNSVSCGSNCFAGYDPNLNDAALDSVTLSDVSTNGSSLRNIAIKVKSKSIVPMTTLQVKVHINNDPVQTLSWNGNISTGDSVSFTVTSYNFNKTYNRIRVWIESVNGTMDDRQENDTIIKSQIICTSPLAGTYSTGCDTCYFDNIQASATTLKTCGVSDPVQIAIEPGYYLEQVHIDSIPFASKADSIVWTSRTGIASDVTLDYGSDYSYYRNPMFLFHAHFCTLNQLTIKNSLPRIYDIMQGDPGGQAVILMERVDNINVTNCYLEGIKKSSAVGGVGDLIDCYVGSNLRFLNNDFKLGTYSIEMGSSVYESRNVIIQDNRGSQNNGLNLYNVDSLLIDRNKFTSIGDEYSAGINLHASDSITITNNLVTTENWGGKALNLSCTCQPVSPCLIANNILASAPLWLPFAGSSITGTNVDVIHNSFGQGVEIGSSGGFRFENNLVRANGDFVIDMNSTTWMTAFNNNRYQSNGLPLNFIEDGTDYTLAGWRTLTGFDLQSDSVTADFTTLTDMHLRNSVAMPGITWPGITTDIDGDVRGASPTIGADEYSFNPLIGEVWPGDCDSTKSVNNFDLLPIGLYYNRFSTSRPNDPSVAWVAQPSLLWNDLQSSGINLNHADANGDGWIDQDDTTVIITNYGLSHPLANPDPQRLTAGPNLAVVPIGTVFAAGDTVHLKVMAGNGVLPVDVLSAIGFQVTVPPGLIVPGSYEVTIANNWLCPDSNCIMYKRADEVTGIAAVSLARLDGDAVSAYGEMADIQFVVNAAYAGNPTVTIPLSDYRAFDPVATPISLSPVDGIIQVTNTSVDELSLIDGVRLFPNPTKSLSTILFNWKGNGTDKMTIRVLDLSGRMVGNAIQFIPQNGTNRVEVDTETFSQGIYFVEMSSNEERRVLKLLKY